jgi:hypothetical protein
MTDLRQWTIAPTSPYMLQLAADARLARTDYVDDQVWELVLGEDDAPGLMLQTRYGGRVNLASLVPMWLHEGHVIYQAQTYVKPPVVTAFAPGYARARAIITPKLVMTADFWVMESHAVGGRFTVENTGKKDSEIRLDLFGQVIAEKKERHTAIMALIDETHALSLGRLTCLEPVVVLEDGRAEIPTGQKASPKIGVDLTLPAGEKASVRWVHAGMDSMAASLERAQFWLQQDWDAAFTQIKQAALAIPVIETDDEEIDAVLAFSYQQLMQAFLNPAENLPYPPFVASRHSKRGFSHRGDGSDYGRGWDGQTPHLSYMTALAIAPIAPELAQGILRNYLAIQAKDGGVPLNAAIVGQSANMLCPPLLARLAWEIYQYTQDLKFLKAVYPALLNFFNRWSEHDLDLDGDILPEWQDERQTGYIFWPTFGANEPWAQNANIRMVETPDSATYMLSEAMSLSKIAQELGDSGAFELQQRVSEFQEHLEKAWFVTENRYAYRERDTDIITPYVAIIEDGRGEEEYLPAIKLDPPSRLVVHVSGGTGKAPRASVYLEGFDKDGNAINETADFTAFSWGHGHGAYTSKHIYAMIDRVRFEGLSRVYRVRVATLDMTRLDINAMLPLWSKGIPADKAAVLVRFLEDEAHFSRPNGVAIVSAQDKNFDSSSAEGGGGVWSYWTTLIGEGLLAYQRSDLAALFVKRLLKSQAAILQREKCFTEFYDSDETKALGEPGFLSGIAPLHLFRQLLGVQLIDKGHVRISGIFGWQSPVTLKQHGVVVHCSKKGFEITFPSGHKVKLPSDGKTQLVSDPKVGDTSECLPEKLTPPKSKSTGVAKRTIIEVEHDPTEK